MQVSLILHGILKINKFREDVYLKMILGLSHSVAWKLAFVLSSRVNFYSLESLGKEVFFWIFEFSM